MTDGRGATLPQSVLDSYLAARTRAQAEDQSGSLKPFEPRAPRLANVEGQPKARTMPHSKYAGKLFPLEHLPADVQEEFPNSVYVKPDGYFDFTPYVHNGHQVDIEAAGKNDVDFRLANEKAKLKETPKGFTWHHHENGVTMQLVPTKLHKALNHWGGVRTIKKGKYVR